MLFGCDACLRMTGIFCIAKMPMSDRDELFSFDKLPLYRNQHLIGGPLMAMPNYIVTAPMVSNVKMSGSGSLELVMLNLNDAKICAA